MLAAAAPHARWIDAFCERGAFDADQAREVLVAGAAAGLRGRLHANQLGPGPGVRLAAELGLVAVDHCTHLGDDDVDALRDSGTIATLLPGVEFSTRQPYPDARRLLDAGVRVALASDCNPGSCFTSSLPFCIAVAVREMGMTPAEAVHAATAGGAAALARDDVGALVPGRRADVVLLEAPSHVHLAYRPGVPLVREVWIEGVRSTGCHTPLHPLGG
jgi:imidazolonepropionase